MPLHSLSLGDFDYTAMYSTHSLQYASSYYSQQVPTTPLLAALPILSAYTMEAFIPIFLTLQQSHGAGIIHALLWIIFQTLIKSLFVKKQIFFTKYPVCFVWQGFVNWNHCRLGIQAGDWYKDLRMINEVSRVMSLWSICSFHWVDSWVHHGEINWRLTGFVFSSCFPAICFHRSHLL